MRDYLSISCTPAAEQCAQIGHDPNAPTRNQIECRVFKNQLERMFPNGPDGTYLSVKAFSHDFGTYREVVVNYDDNDEESVNYAFGIEQDMPEFWDDEAKKELEEALEKVGLNPLPYAN